MGIFNKRVFLMPDGSALKSNRDVDRYYGLSLGTTANRLHRDWTVEECANNKRETEEKDIRYVFRMPNGSILHNRRDVDRYHNLGLGTTAGRLDRGWSEQECANNEKKAKYTFKMPDGSVLHRCYEVDDYYKFKRRGITANRINSGWSEQECANNKKEEKGVHTFYMPDGSVLKRFTDVDRYHKLKLGTTSRRLTLDWTADECANNERDENRKSEYVFKMPDGSILTECRYVDKYYGLSRGTTRGKLAGGWTIEECANNVELPKRLKK